MNDILSFAGDNWWLIFPIGAVVGGWVGSVAKYNEKRRKDKIELARIKAGAQTEQVRPATVSADQLRRTLARHDALNEKWFAYEVDLATLISYPMMIDMREPLTLAFHKAKVRADDLRPAADHAPSTPADLAEYRDAVEDYAAAFDAAEREARRRKQSGFSPVERETLDRAAKLINVALDSGATAAERQSAYKKARAELDGLIDVPQVAAAQLERAIAGALEQRRD